MLLLFAALLCGCDRYHAVAGRAAERRGKWPAALAHYEAILKSGGAGPEIRLRAAGLYARMQRCAEARSLYEAVARAGPDGEHGIKAKKGLMSCPAYFPLEPGRRWVYGDSASKGKAMRLEWEARRSTGPAVAVEQALFAGAKLVKKTRADYEIVGWSLLMSDEEGRFPLLEFPFEIGRTWKAKRGARLLTYSVESDDAAAETAAGTFDKCLKVRETTEGFDESWRFDYYCPGVGRALTTVAGPGFENPNTELLSYE